MRTPPSRPVVRVWQLYLASRRLMVLHRSGHLDDAALGSGLDAVEAELVGARSGSVCADALAELLGRPALLTRGVALLLLACVLGAGMTG